MKILVTGGAGYIGSHTITDLVSHGFEVISIDNFSRSSIRSLSGIKKITGCEITNYAIDLCDARQVETVFQENPDMVGIIHFAAFKSVPESVAYPLRYYRNNMESLFTVLECMEKFSIPNLVFSSSCSVYGNVDKLPVDENTPLAKPECAYAASKQMGEQVILDFSNISSSRSMLLRYFNPVGAHPSAEIGEMPIDRPNNLVPVITQTAIGQLEKMSVWGNDYPTRDGSCIRDYIHVMDIAAAHTKALQYLLSAPNCNRYEVLNLGSGQGVSVLEAIASFEKVSGVTLNYEIGPRRMGDVMAIYADNELARTRLNWEPKYTLDDMMRTAWEWQLRLKGKT